uniref:Uncharacterized protein n=1 Tax=Oryza sativa subsp. japonica TaxID=39947 RepID=Q5SNC6_ORYSJ|nr:hypothetical protein [Oryza sativa Japonica Group]
MARADSPSSRSYRRGECGGGGGAACKTAKKQESDSDVLFLNSEGAYKGNQADYCCQFKKQEHCNASVE